MAAVVPGAILGAAGIGSVVYGESQAVLPEAVPTVEGLLEVAAGEGVITAEQSSILADIAVTFEDILEMLPLVL